jgi:hypothetical protein
MALTKSTTSIAGARGEKRRPCSTGNKLQLVQVTNLNSNGIDIIGYRKYSRQASYEKTIFQSKSNMLLPDSPREILKDSPFLRQAEWRPLTGSGWQEGVIAEGGQPLRNGQAAIPLRRGIGSMDLYSTFSAGAGRIRIKLSSKAMGARDFTYTVSRGLPPIDLCCTLFGRWSE